MSTSLNTLGQIKTEFLVRAYGNTTSAFLDDTILNNWADQAYKRVVGAKKWPETEGRVSTTFASFVTDEDGMTVGEYPEGWRSESIRMLKIGGQTYQKTNFYQLRKLIEDNPQNDDRLYSDFSRRIYVTGNPSGTVAMWGQYTPVLDLTDDSSTTVFSEGSVDLNEAIVEIMMSFHSYRKQKRQDAINHLAVAKSIIDNAWEKIGDEQFGYQPTDSEGMWKRIDVVGGGYHEDSLNTDQF